MFEFITNHEDRGQVGIGTLIVFIAMVLVAAIAAGVLINTAGFLQSQAEATGQESTDLVSERIEVGSSVGIVASGADTLDEIRVSVSGAPGSDNIDLTETTIQAVGPGGQENLVFQAGGSLDNSPRTPTATEEIDAQNESAPSASSIEVGVGSLGTPGDFKLIADDGTNVANLSSVTADGTNDITDVGANLSVSDGDTIEVRLRNTTSGTVNATDTVQVVDTVTSASELGDTEFAIRDDGTLQRSAVLNSESQFQIIINPASSAFNDGTAFQEGQQATLDIVSPAGATTQVELRAPDLFNSEDEAVRL